MYLQTLTTAVPPHPYDQPQCWEIIDQSPAKARLHKRSRLILHKILRGESGVSRRHFAVKDIHRIFDFSADELNRAFREEAPRLAEAALLPALEQCGLKPADLDALFICTCTGYLCPGVTSYVAEHLGLRPDTYLHDVVGLGCGAAIPSLRAANGYLAANPDAVVACIAVEICSAAFFLDDDPGVLISACLFSDGAAATVWRSRPPEAGRGGLGAGAQIRAFQTVHQPEHRDMIRFELRDGKLRNLLDRSVPDLAAAAVAELWSKKGPQAVRQIISHSGGADVLDALTAALPGRSLEASRHVLRNYGNMSSPSVLFALDHALRTPAPDEPAGDFWLVSFGAGFSAHSCRLTPAG